MIMLTEWNEIQIFFLGNHVISAGFYKYMSFFIVTHVSRAMLYQVRQQASLPGKKSHME